MKKRIAFISEHASPLATLGGVDSGGQNVYVGELAKHLVASGYEIDIFTRWDNPKLPKVISWLPHIRVIHIPAGPVKVLEKESLFAYMPEFTINMVNFIMAEDVGYELIHANFFMSAMVAADIKKLLAIPFVVTFHALGYIRKIYQGDRDRFPAERIAIEKQIATDADHIIAECPQDKQDLLQYYDADPDKITIIPCGFSPHEFHPIDKLLARMVLHLEPDECIILQLGRIVPRKGIDNVIRALSRIRKTSTEAKLLVVGGETDDTDPISNPEIARLQNIARDEGVIDAVIFTGRRSREVLKYYYAAADVFVTTPWYEPFGITPLESMACGTPVIGSNVGGIKYSIEDGNTGYVVPPNDPDALAEKIQELLTDKALHERMKQRAIRRVNTLFTWAKVAHTMADLYERILLKTSPQPIEVKRSVAFIENSFEHAAQTMQRSKTVLSSNVYEAADLLTKAFRKRKKILVCGNGGSAAESQHLVAELVGRFEVANRNPIAAISLTADTAILTAWANDIGYDDVFARQVDAYGQRGDVLFCLSTSGQSTNVINAIKAALEKEMFCIVLSGKGGGEMSLYAHVNIIVPSNNTQRIQEIHLHIIHTLCSIVEFNLFSNNRNGDASLYKNDHARMADAKGLKI